MQTEQLLRAGHEEFLRRVRQVAPDTLAAPTPCTDWDVRALLSHVLGGDHGYAALLRGADTEQFMAVRKAFVLDEAALVPQAEASGEALIAAFSEPGALERTVAHPIGEIPATRLLGMRLTEWVVHGWDLARAIGADEHMDEGLAADLYEQLSPRAAEFARGTFFSPGAGVPPEAPIQVRLLDLLGRRA